MSIFLLTIVILAIVTSVAVIPSRLVAQRSRGLAIKDLDPEERLKAENEVRTKATAALVLGFGLVLTLLQLDQMQRGAIETQRATQRQLELAAAGQLTDRFTRAVNQLGDASRDIRLGGVYGLRSIFLNSAEYREAVVEVLAAYVRAHAKPPSDHLEHRPAPEPLLARSPDVQAALTVLGF